MNIALSTAIAPKAHEFPSPDRRYIASFVNRRPGSQGMPDTAMFMLNGISLAGCEPHAYWTGCSNYVAVFQYKEGRAGEAPTKLLRVIHVPRDNLITVISGDSLSVASSFGRGIIQVTRYQDFKAVARAGAAVQQLGWANDDKVTELRLASGAHDNNTQAG